MAFGFGRLPGFPAGMTQEDLAAILAAAPPGASTLQQARPFGFGPLAAPTGAPMGLPGAPAGDGAMLAPSFGEEAAQPALQTPSGLTLPGPPPEDKPAPHSIFGDARREASDRRAARALSFGPMSPQPAAPTMPPSVTSAEFDRRFDDSPPGEGYGLTASIAEALRAGLTRQGAPLADMPAPDAVPAAGGAPAPSFAVPAGRGGNATFDGAGKQLPPTTPTPAPPAVPFGFGPISPAGGAPSAANVPAAVAAPADEGDGFLSRLSDPRVYNTLLGIGQGLLTTKGFGPGIAAGTAYASKLNKDQAATDLAGAEFGLKRNKLAQEVAGQNSTVELLVKAGHSRESAQGMMMAAAAGNREALNNAMGNLVPKVETPSGFTRSADGSVQFIPGGPQDPTTIAAQAKAREADKTQTPLTDPEARASAGIAPNDKRPAWRDPDGKVTFNDGPKAQTATMIGPDGTKATRVYNPATGTFDAPDYGASPPRSSIDTSNVPPGVDAATYRKELAKATVQEQRGASQRATQANNAISVLDRAERAYSRLGEMKAIGPYSASTFNRTLGGAFGADVEVQRQEYEAASKDLELLKAQISMKGQGSITDSERRLLAHTLPRLDAASPETGLTTLRQMRDQFSRSMSADRLPSYGAGRADPGTPAAPVTPVQPSRDTLEAEARRRGLIQ